MVDVTVAGVWTGVMVPSARSPSRINVLTPHGWDAFEDPSAHQAMQLRRCRFDGSPLKTNNFIDIKRSAGSEFFEIDAAAVPTVT